MRKTIITTALLTTLFSLGLATTTVAGPHHGGGMHRPPAVHHHPAPPPPRPMPYHYHGYHNRYYVSDWVAPLFVGAAILGTAEAIRAANDAAVTTTYTPAPVANTVTPITNNTRFWCESEKGFYPEVRACPLGWTPIPAQ